MKAMAIIRESIYESTEEQRLSITTFARTEGIDVSCWHQTLTDELYDEINENQGVSLSHYEYLTDRIDMLCSDLSTKCMIAYVEAEYFGGIGSQNGIVWRNKQVIFEETTSENAINKSLVYLGVSNLDGKDEFDTVGLGRHRIINDWITKEIHI